MRPSPRRPALAVTLAFAVAGGAGAFAVNQRAEALFFRQQTAQGSLAEAIGTAELGRPALTERLYSLEDELHEACAPLREAGQRKVGGQAIEPDLEWAVAVALDVCARKTAQVETLVQQTGSGAADLPATDLGTAAGPAWW